MTLDMPHWRCLFLKKLRTLKANSFLFNLVIDKLQVTWQKCCHGRKSMTDSISPELTSVLFKYSYELLLLTLFCFINTIPTQYFHLCRFFYVVVYQMTRVYYHGGPNSIYWSGEREQREALAAVSTWGANNLFPIKLNYQPKLSALGSLSVQPKLIDVPKGDLENWFIIRVDSTSKLEFSHLPVL